MCAGRGSFIRRDLNRARLASGVAPFYTSDEVEHQAGRDFHLLSTVFSQGINNRALSRPCECLVGCRLSVVRGCAGKCRAPFWPRLGSCEISLTHQILYAVDLQGMAVHTRVDGCLCRLENI